MIARSIISSPSGSVHPPLDTVLIGTSLKVEIEQAVQLGLAVTLHLIHAATRIDLLLNKTRPIPVVTKALQANLHAAAQHAALGHEAPTFRDCPRPMCLDAANLIGQPMVSEPGATDAELDAIFERLMYDPAMDAIQAIMAT
jgi:hypothetical protein